jgi:hypothetical protein
VDIVAFVGRGVERIGMDGENSSGLGEGNVQIAADANLHKEGRICNSHTAASKDVRALLIYYLLIYSCLQSLFGS